MASLGLHIFTLLCLSCPCWPETAPNLPEKYYGLRQESHAKAAEFLEGLSTEELALACRQDIEAMPKLFAGLDERDTRRPLIAMYRIAPFVQRYLRLSLKEAKDVDPTPYHAMMLDRSLNKECRLVLVEMLGDSDFYEPGWKYYLQDVKTYQQILDDEKAELEVRLEAASNISSFTKSLYLKLCRQCPALKKHSPDSDTADTKFPDVARILHEDQNEFTEEERNRLTSLFTNANMVASKSMALVKTNPTERARLLTCNLIRRLFRRHLLNGRALKAEVEEFLDSR